MEGGLIVLVGAVDNVQEHGFRPAINSAAEMVVAKAILSVSRHENWAPALLPFGGHSGGDALEEGRPSCAEVREQDAAAQVTLCSDAWTQCSEVQLQQC